MSTLPHPSGGRGLKPGGRAADVGCVRGHATAGAASSRVMVETLAVLYGASTLAGVLIALGSDLDGPRWVVVGVLVALCVPVPVGLLLFPDRVHGRVLHALLGLPSLLLAAAVGVPPEPASAVAVACVIAFVVVEVCYFLPPESARFHLAAGWAASNGSLLLRGDVSPWTVLAMDCILLALAVVTRRLSVRASDADTDPLTGLPNRRGFDDLLQQRIHAGGTLSVALLDLDHFKQINDTAGHEAGDRVLLRVAEEPARVLPRGAVLARQGGDEFALLLPDLGGAEATAAVWRVCDALDGIGLSCGVAEYERGESAAQLVRRADGALYAAKAAGRGRVHLAGAVRS